MVLDMLLLFLKKKIIDLFIDPPSKNANFYPPNTFVEAKIERRISKRGGYFCKVTQWKSGVS